MLVVFSLVVMVGGHWAILQSVAWVGMAFNFAQTAPLDVALKKTFDGKHRCSLCKAVEAGKQSERKAALLKLETKLELCLAPCALLLDTPPLVTVIPGAAEAALPRNLSPPVPPPRTA
jgi:hypothetical protein